MELRDQLQSTLGQSYTLERELGGGGMSRVFVARETSLGREVVVKVLSPELSAGVSAERFAREIATAARLQQANIVPVLTAGESAGLPYYTMPFVRGESLRSGLARGTAMPVSDAISILRDVARALAYAHAEGVIHRDIKPENILLSGGTAVVTDFGIAKAISAARTLDSANARGADGTLTQVGSSVGTPAYMAPEQAVGDAVDQRADLYSWGVVAYELLSGAHPFAGKTGTAQLIAAHLTEVPRPLAGLCPDLPRDVADLVMQCLQKQPSQRPDNAQAMLARLSAIVTPGASQPGRAGSAPTAKSAQRRTRVAVAALAAALLLVVAALYAWKSRTASPKAARTIVVIPFDNLGDSTDAYFAEGVSEEIGSQLARIPGLQVIGRTGVQRYRGSNKTPREIAQELGAAYVLSGSVRWARAAGLASTSGDTRVRIVPALLDVSTGLQAWGESFDERLTDVFKLQADVAERVASALSITLGTEARAALRRPDSRSPGARDAQLLGRHLLRQRGLTSLRQAAVEFRRAIEQDSSYARAWAGYSEANVLRPSYSDTVAMDSVLVEAERSARRAVALDSMLPEAQVALARAQFTAFQFNAALRTSTRAIQLDPSSAFAHALRYESLLALGRVAESETEVRRAIELDRFASFLHIELAFWFQAAGRVDSALQSTEHAVELDPVPTWQLVRSLFLPSLGRSDEAVKACTMYTRDVRRCHALFVPPQPTARERQLALSELAALARDPMVATWSGPTVQALTFMSLGLPDSAFARLRTAVDRRDPIFFYESYAPALAPLHGDPRWDALFREVRSR